MAAFIAIAVVLGLAVLAVLLRPLWKHTRGLALGIGAVLAVSAGLLYMLVGTPRALQPGTTQAPVTLGDAINQLEAELQRDPRQPDGWRLLAQAYAREGKAEAARDAYAKAVALLPDDVDLAVEAAQARALAHPTRLFDADAVAMLERALASQPGHQRARWFLGIAQRQAGRHAEAATTWEPLLAQVDAATATSLRNEVNAARSDAGLPPLPEAAASSDALVVKVTLDPDFAARVRLSGNASIFVIARRPGGPPIPVAAEKHPVSALPLTVTLDDNDSLMPTAKLSQLQEVELVARLSASGSADDNEGDVDSAPVRVTMPAKAPVQLVIGAQ